VNVADCVTVNTTLPKAGYEGLWDSIVIENELKERILHAALLAFKLRPRLSTEVTALHGLILLYGPPGTGKTTLARGLAAEVAPLTGGAKARLVELKAHGLMSAEHGQSQRHVYELLGAHVPALADDGLPTIVLLDEVESMAVARSAASLSANPADVHRATDAVLTALDQVSREHPHIVFVATSNFTEALDEAFVSRADVAVEVSLPDARAIAAILERTLLDFAGAYPKLGKLAKSPGIPTVARRMKGWDGRRARKLVTAALAIRLETVLDPEKLTIKDLNDAAIAEQREVVRHEAA
jgi:AAA+ superfamily predicted ATPase